MNIIKELYFKWLAYTGRLNETNLHILCMAMHPEADDENKARRLDDYYNGSELNWQLDGWAKGKMSKLDVYAILQTYFRHHVPSRETQFKLLENPSAAFIYLQELKHRKQPWAHGEEEMFLEMPPQWWKQLSRPLDDDYACLLLDTEDFNLLEDYLHRFKLGVKGEKYLVQKVAENVEEKREKCDFHQLACDYVLLHSRQVFASKEAQLALVNADNCDDLLLAVVGQASMQRPYLFDATIRGLIFNHRAALNKFLAQSYIANPEVLAFLLKHVLLCNQKHLLYISQIKLMIHQQFKADFEPYEELPMLRLTSEEQKIITIAGPLRRFHAVQDKILPRLQTGEVSPAMTSWLVLNYPLTPQMMTQATISTMIYAQKLFRQMRVEPLVINNGLPFGI